MANNSYTVSELVGEMRHLLESSYRNIEVEGEISNLASPASGHLYFSLKEQDALVRCAFFRNRRRGSETPREGMQVRVRGQISIYPGRGDLQLIVTRLEQSGEGALRRAFEALKKKLQAEGLFDSTSKRPLPSRPGAIGIVTSATGAALHDMLVTLSRRYPIARVVVYPALVQGPEAPASICQMIEVAAQRDEVDVLLLARGGGSLEDLQAFNEESVARAIAGCPIPLVSGVGHETDFTIADMVADLRGATPTAAASLITPDLGEYRGGLVQTHTRLIRQAERALDSLRQRIDITTSRLIHPDQFLARLDEQRRRHHRDLERIVVLELADRRHRLERFQDGLSAHSPGHLLARCQDQQHDRTERLRRNALSRLGSLHQQLSLHQKSLQIMNPAHTLKRGYAILQNEDGEVVTSRKRIRKGAELNATVADGEFRVVVDATTAS